MKTKVRGMLGMWVLCAILVSGCGIIRARTAGEGAQAGLPNPSAVYCEEQGGRYEIVTAEDGSQDGICVFEDGSECNGWAFYRGECGPGTGAAPADTPDAESMPQDEGATNGDDIDPSETVDESAAGIGMANPASVYCEEHGGSVEIQTDEEGNQAGVCVLADGTRCDEWAYFLGECGPTAASAQDAGDEANVMGWHGVIVATDDQGAGYRLNLLPEGSGTVPLRVGETSSGENIAEALATASDSTVPVHVWGTRTCAEPTCPIEVTRVLPDNATATSAPEPVVSWQGTLESLPEGAQFDDIFVFYDPDFRIEYGVDAADPNVAAQLEGLRDIGRFCFVSGELTCNVPDVNGCQIRVERVEVRE